MDQYIYKFWTFNFKRVVIVFVEKNYFEFAISL